MNPAARRIAAGVAAVLAIAVGVRTFGSTPAGADAGDASAFVFTTNLGATVLGTPIVALSGTVDSVSVTEGNGPANGTTGVVGLSGTGVTADATVTAVTADSSTATPAAAASLASASVTVLGQPLISGSALTAAATCSASPTSSASIATLSVLGTTVDLESGPATVAVGISGIGVPGGLASGTLSASVSEVETTTATAATAAALDLTAHLQLSLLGLPIFDADIGTVTIAGAACETAATVTPTAVSLAPTHGPTAGGTDVTITGTGFVPGNTSVAIDTTTIAPGNVTVNGAGTTATFTTPPTETPGTVNVTVTTPAGTSGPLGYAYDPPTITGVVPPTGPITGATPVLILGTGLDQATGAIFGGNPATGVTPIDSTVVDAVTPAHAAGPVDVTVTLPGMDATLTDGYTYVTVGLPPTALSLDPDHGPTAGSTDVTVTGSGFVPGATIIDIDTTTIAAGSVTVGGLGTTATFTTPATETPGTVNITVTTPGGTSGPLGYFYDPPTLVVTPAEGPTDGGTAVVLSGSGLDQATRTSFDHDDAPDMTFMAASHWDAHTPAHAAGPVDVTITLPGMDAVAVDGFTYVAAAPATTTTTTGTTATTAPTTTPTTGPSTSPTTAPGGGTNGTRQPVLGSAAGIPLVRTGTDAIRLAGFALICLVTGTVLAAWTRRRRRSGTVSSES